MSAARCCATLGAGAWLLVACRASPAAPSPQRITLHVPSALDRIEAAGWLHCELQSSRAGAPLHVRCALQSHESSASIATSLASAIAARAAGARAEETRLARFASLTDRSEDLVLPAGVVLLELRWEPIGPPTPPPCEAWCGARRLL